MQRNMMHYRNVLLSPMKNCIKQWKNRKIRLSSYKTGFGVNTGNSCLKYRLIELSIFVSS